MGAGDRPFPGERPPDQQRTRDESEPQREQAGDEPGQAEEEEGAGWDQRQDREPFEDVQATGPPMCRSGCGSERVAVCHGAAPLGVDAPARVGATRLGPSGAIPAPAWGRLVDPALGRRSLASGRSARPIKNVDRMMRSIRRAGRTSSTKLASLADPAAEASPTTKPTKP